MSNSLIAHWTIALLLFAAAVAPTAATADEDGDDGSTSGGNINNIPPSVLDWSASSGGRAEPETTEVLAGSVKDNNGRADLAAIRIQLVAGPVDVGYAEYEFEDVEDLPVSRPNGLDDGWKVWVDDAADDGVVFFEYHHSYAEDSGDYRWAMSVQDDDDEDNDVWRAAAQDLVVTVGWDISTYLVPYRSTNTPEDQGTAWGLWTADPGDSEVVAQNFIRVDNTGADANQLFTVDYNEAAFTGGSSHEIPIVGNLRFARLEVTPAELGAADFEIELEDFSAWVDDVAGGAQFQFSALDNTIFVAYQIVEVPGTIADDTYSATFTVMAN